MTIELILQCQPYFTLTLLAAAALMFFLYKANREVIKNSLMIVLSVLTGAQFVFFGSWLQSGASRHVKAVQWIDLPESKTAFGLGLLLDGFSMVSILCVLMVALLWGRKVTTRIQAAALLGAVAGLHLLLSSLTAWGALLGYFIVQLALLLTEAELQGESEVPGRSFRRLVLVSMASTAFWAATYLALSGFAGWVDFSGEIASTGNNEMSGLILFFFGLALVFSLRVFPYAVCLSAARKPDGFQHGVLLEALLLFGTLGLGYRLIPFLRDLPFWDIFLITFSLLVLISSFVLICASGTRARWSRWLSQFFALCTLFCIVLDHSQNFLGAATSIASVALVILCSHFLFNRAWAIALGIVIAGFFLPYGLAVGKNLASVVGIIEEVNAQSLILWACVFLFFLGTWQQFWVLESEKTDPKPIHWFEWISFFTLLALSLQFAWTLVFHSTKLWLPLGSGGVFGGEAITPYDFSMTQVYTLISICVAFALLLAWVRRALVALPHSEKGVIRFFQNNAFLDPFFGEVFKRTTYAMQLLQETKLFVWGDQTWKAAHGFLLSFERINRSFEGFASSRMWSFWSKGLQWSSAGFRTVQSGNSFRYVLLALVFVLLLVLKALLGGV